MKIVRILGVLFCLLGPISRAERSDEPSLWQIQQILADKKMVDLTHAFALVFRIGPVSRMRKGRRFIGTTKNPTRWAKDFSARHCPHVGQWGTHIDPPAALSPRRSDGGPDRFAGNDPAPGCDRRAPWRLAKNRITRSPRAGEKMGSRAWAIPAKALSRWRTDWSKRWPDSAAMENEDCRKGWRITRMGVSPR